MARPSQYRNWMLGSVSFLATGCLVPDAPEYGVAATGDVFVDQSSISPDPRGVIRVDNAAPTVLDLRFLVHSEDGTQELVSAFYLDYKHDGAQYIDHKSYHPSSFDAPHTISWPLVFPKPYFPSTPECHILTVTVLHEDGWNFEQNQQIGTPTDLAAVSWLVDFNDRDGLLPLSKCPDVSGSSSETGR